LRASVPAPAISDIEKTMSGCWLNKSTARQLT